MVDQITEKLYHELIRSFPPTTSYSLSDLSAREIRNDIFHYLSFVLEERAVREVEDLSIPSSPWFDYTDESIQSRWSDFVVGLKKHPIFPADSWADELEGAVRAVVSCTLKPVSGLTDLLFGQQEEIRPSTIVGFVERFTTHDQILSAARDVGSQSERPSVSRDEFRSQLAKRLTADQPTEVHEITGLVEPALKIVEAATAQTAVPVEIVTSFFDDIGMRSVSDKIHQHATRYNLENVNLDQLSDGLALARGSSDSTQLQEVEDVAEIVVEPVPVPAIEAVAPVESSSNGDVEQTAVEEDSEFPGTEASDSDSDPFEIEDDSAPLWKKFQKKLNAPVTNPDKEEILVDQSQSAPASSGAAEPISEYVTSDSPTVPIWERFRARTTTGASPEDLGAAELRVLGESVQGRRSEYLVALFNSSEDDYRDVILELDSLADWDSASLYIADKVFRKNRVNIYSEIAVSFTNAVEQRYRAIQTQDADTR